MTSDGESPSSPLPLAGETAEACFEQSVDETFYDFDHPEHAFQGTETVLQEGSESKRVGGLFKRKGAPTAELKSQDSLATEQSWKPQMAFAVLVDSIAEECNDYARFNSRLDDQISDVALRMQRREKTVFPWDDLPHRNLWKIPSSADSFKLPLLGRFDKPSMRPVGDMAEDKHAQWITEQPFAGKRLIASRFAKSDDALLSGALRKLRNLILFCPGDSQLGRALVNKAGSLIAEDVLQKSLKDSVSGKAVSTVVKRVSDYNKFAEYLVTVCHKRPLCPDEATFYRYVCHMQSSGFGATAGGTLLKAWAFFRYTFGIDAESQSALISGRVRGVVNNMFAAKRKLEQAPPIPADYVYKMEYFMRTGNDDRLRTIVGFLLFCIYSCARFGDAAKADPRALEFQQSSSADLTLVEIGLSEYKTATGERKAVLLPLIALGCGLDSYSWSEQWRIARQETKADQKAYLMCAEDHNRETWLDRRMTTAEGSFWVKDVLVMLGMEAKLAAGYSTHSLKATCLSWASKAGSLSLQERLWLGHHESEESRMAITYARDALVGSLIKLRLVVEAIKKGLFDPDLSRAERMAQATGLVVDPRTIAEKSNVEAELEQRLSEEEIQIAAQLGESDVEDTAGIEAQPIHLPGEKEALGRHAFPNVDLSCCFKHRLSGIVHLISDTERLSCGRKITCNMIPMQGDEDSSAQLEFCEQCRAVSGFES